MDVVLVLVLVLLRGGVLTAVPVRAGGVLCHGRQDDDGRQLMLAEANAGDGGGGGGRRPWVVWRCGRSDVTILSCLLSSRGAAPRRGRRHHRESKEEEEEGERERKTKVRQGAREGKRFKCPRCLSYKVDDRHVLYCIHASYITLLLHFDSLLATSHHRLPGPVSVCAGVE